ncbi:MAG TPA: hypothetical protein VMZ71_02805 [Gemmataceae bacterium]|nr:hypothetical protein [Gemmataceae bacterium]
MKRQLDAGPIEFRHLDPSQAWPLSEELRRLGAVFKTEPDDAPPPPPPPRKKKPGVADLATKLAAIGPHTIHSDTEDEWVAAWDAPPALDSPLGPFGLEFRIESLDGGEPLRPDKKMFALWETWRSRHTEWAVTMQQAVEERMRDAGVTGLASAAVHTREVSISRVDDGDEREYTASATIGLEFDAEHGMAYRIDEDTGELVFWG